MAFQFIYAVNNWKEKLFTLVDIFFGELLIFGEDVYFSSQVKDLLDIFLLSSLIKTGII